VRRIEQRLFLLFVALLPVFQPLYVRLFGSGPIVIVADVVFVVTTLIWIVALFRRTASLRFNGFHVAAGAYFVALCLSALFSIDRTASLVKLVGAAYLIGIAVLAISLVRTWEELSHVLHMWIASTAVVALVGIAGLLLFIAGFRSPDQNFALSGFGSLPAGLYPRIRATFANANLLCSYLAIGVMLLAFMLSIDRARRAWYLVVSAGAWMVAMLSLSPGIGGLFLSLGIWEWRRRGDDASRRAFAGAALGTGIVAGVALFAAALVDPSRLDDGGLALSAIGPSPRVEMWRRSFQVFLEHPIVGQGIGTGADTFNYLAASGQPQALTDAYNVWLSVAMQSGVLGVSAFIGLVAYAWRRSAPWGGDNHRISGLKLALRCALVSSLFYQGLTGSFEEARHIWLVFGLMVCAGAHESVHRRTEAA